MPSPSPSPSPSCPTTQRTQCVATLIPPSYLNDGEISCSDDTLHFTSWSPLFSCSHLSLVSSLLLTTSLISFFNYNNRLMLMPVTWFPSAPEYHHTFVICFWYRHRVPPIPPFFCRWMFAAQTDVMQHIGLLVHGLAVPFNLLSRRFSVAVDNSRGVFRWGFCWHA